MKMLLSRGEKIRRLLPGIFTQQISVEILNEAFRLAMKKKLSKTLSICYEKFCVHQNTRVVKLCLMPYLPIKMLMVDSLDLSKMMKRRCIKFSPNSFSSYLFFDYHQSLHNIFLHWFRKEMHNEIIRRRIFTTLHTHFPTINLIAK